MILFVVHRLLHAIPTIIGITIISFCLMRITPGDPIAVLLSRNNDIQPESLERLRRQLSLDQPIPIQYLYWLIGNDWTMIDVDGDGVGDIAGTHFGILRGDFGKSISQRRPIIELFAERIPATLQLTFSALVLGYNIGIFLGILAAANHRTWIDHLVRIISLLGTAIPSFWMALLFIMFFGVTLQLLPLSGMRDLSNPNATFIDNLKYMIMPVMVLAIGTLATICRYVRTKMLELMAEDYIRTARAKGMENYVVWWKHAFRNAMIPLATLIGPAISMLLTGAVIVETIFSWPGIGRLIVNAVFERDYPLIMGGVIMTSWLYVFGLILSDLLYIVLDPRIRIR